MSIIHFSLPIIDYLRILRKKIWIVIVIFLLVEGLTAYSTFRQAPIYQSICKIRYKRGSTASYLAAGSAFQFLSPYYDTVSFETEKHVIKSKLIAGGVVKTLGLASPEEYSRWKNWVKRVQGALEVSKLKDTRIYMITSHSPDPDLAQALANTAAAVYIDFSLKEKQESAEKTLTVLTGQIDDLKDKIQRSEMAKIDYVKRTGEVPLGENEFSGQQLSAYQHGQLLKDLRSLLVRAEIEREQLLNRYLEHHPRVKASERQIEVLKEKISAENSRIIQAHKEAIEYGILEKEAQANQDQYKVLIKKLKDLNLSDSGIESGIEIIERAERPTVPIAPTKKKNLTLGAILGLVLGLGAVLILEYFDPTLQTSEELESCLDVPVLASIPRMTAPVGLTKEEAAQFLFHVVESQAKGVSAEMFKRLRSSIHPGDFRDERFALMITSSSAREGKTTITANLATAMAQAGLKTVIVDGDMRRPAIGQIFQISNEGGLSSFLNGDADCDQVVFPTGIDGLQVIPSGSIPPNPSELLESPRFVQLIKQLKEKFDRIIIDSPPAGALADASIIGNAVDGVILVCFAGHIDKKFVLRTKQQLEKGGAKIYGAVLNYIELKLRSYYHYYQSVYKYGYH